ncbi:hypothetical protein BDV38DRAFT_283194 [Aspergillus pseudotamarii]|uniref:Uncharacterized protein n=1 Tax=Aspergillus pseudotamarii TaxID=132259 RepID=A0A5N6SW62_ASPPS|nr:uncharacterized protein BDV38DRAFT_283194 [Aspergillus pseudotamarii]KAE8137354.1 hypothetical protein BDV38DRAFT_283194 [Aspergillus pseudotamarii]
MIFTVLPFGATNSQQRRLYYPLLLADVVRDCTDAIDALTVFHNLLSTKETIGNGTTGFKAFDGHVGDTACHIRAGILLDIFAFYREDQGEVMGCRRGELSISSYISNLKLTCNNAQMACSRLTSDNVCPSTLGFGPKHDIMENIITTLGWKEPNDRLGLNDAVDPEWNVEDPQLIIRYLVAMFVLAKYKEHCKLSSHNIVVRLRPKNAAVYGNELISPFWDRNNCQYKEPGCNRLDVRFAALQKWVSALSCSWVRAWSEKLFVTPATQRLVRSSVLQSPKGLLVTATYTGFLVCRQVWAKSQWPLLLVDRHFCSGGTHRTYPFVTRSCAWLKAGTGYHLNAYIATLQQQPKSPSDRRSDMAINIAWQIRPKTFNELLTYDKGNQPMISILGNSVEGPLDDYTARIANMSPDGSLGLSAQQHREEFCGENVEHRKRFLATDQDRLSLAFFADHRCYPFPLHALAAGHDDGEYLPSLIRSLSQNDPTEEHFINSKLEVDELGAGKGYMGIFRWEHILAETPGRLANILQDWEGKGVFA